MSFQSKLQNTSTLNEKILQEAVKVFAQRFGFKNENWIKLSIDRVYSVQQLSKYKYLVPGISGKDRKSRYTVTFTGTNIHGDDEFLCPCQFTSNKSWGLHRKKVLCTHAGSVILFMMYQRKLKEYEKLHQT